MDRLKILLALTLIFSCTFLAGCFEEREEIEKEILTYDPSFQNTIDKRNTMEEELETALLVYQRKIQEVDEQVAALKEEKIIAKTEYTAQVERIKRRLNPEKGTLKSDLVDMTRSYKIKNIQVREIDKDIKEISSLIDKEDKLSLTQEEMKTWNDRLSSLIEKKEEVAGERDKLQADIHATELKLKVLRIKK